MAHEYGSCPSAVRNFFLTANHVTERGLKMYLLINGEWYSDSIDSKPTRSLETSLRHYCNKLTTAL